MTYETETDTYAEGYSAARHATGWTNPYRGIRADAWERGYADGKAARARMMEGN